MYDTARDAEVAALPSFRAFARRLSLIRRLRALYGAAETERLALAFVYSVVSLPTPADAWLTFWADVTHPTWMYFAIANLQNFSADEDVIDFQDRLTIRTRDYAALTRLLGWARDRLDASVGNDWMQGFGTSQYVLIAAEEVPKTPANVVLMNTGTEWPRVQRLLVAMRLVAAGDVRVGRLFFGRREVVELTGGISSTGRFAASGPGAPYVLPNARVPEVDDFYARLRDFDQGHRERLGNIALALDRFTGTFDRPWGSLADYLIDDMIALEAIVGTKDELAFTIAFRVSGMLEGDDRARLATFRMLKSFYSTRSDLVHGAKLKTRASNDLAREGELRNVVRRLLRGLVRLIGSPYDPTPEFVKDRLDDLLLDAAQRLSLTAALQP